MGLIGGSLAKALKRTGKGYEVIAWNRCSEPILQAIKDGVVDRQVSEDFHEFSGCRILFVCVPVDCIHDCVERVKPFLSEDCLLTDVGSTKGDVEKVIASLGLCAQFVGGHPLAGSEQSGYGASKANLFENAYYVMTANSKNKIDPSLLKTIIQDIGAIPLEMDAAEHDRVVAAISHVPHVVASLLVNLVQKLDGPQAFMKTLAAGGFKDITRIASSSPQLWTAISLANSEAVLETLGAMKNLLESFEEDLRHNGKDALTAYFTDAKNYRNAFSDLNKGILQKTYDMVVDVEDKPGIIAAIATAFAEQSINIKNIGINNSREHDEGALEIRFENEESRTRGLHTLLKLGYAAKARV